MKPFVSAFRLGSSPLHDEPSVRLTATHTNLYSRPRSARDYRSVAAGKSNFQDRHHG